MKFLVAVAVIVTAATLFAQSASAQAPPVEPDFFGTVLSASSTAVVIRTANGDVTVAVAADSQIRLPSERDAAASDLVEGDFVAVTLQSVNGDLVLDVIQVIPGKTEIRHLPGTVVTVSADALTIQPPNPKATPITFAISATSTELFLKDSEPIQPGDFVIVVTTRDPQTGELAREVHVKARPSVSPPGPAGSATSTPPVVQQQGDPVTLRGIFEGVDDAGNWIIDGKTVTLGKNTRVGAAIAAGDTVEVKGLLLPDGVLLARKISIEEDKNDVSKTSRIEGPFQGIDADGNWLIGGTPVRVTDATDTDGLPFEGQRVRVKGLLQADGTIVAREIENKEGKEKAEEGEGDEVKIRGAFGGVDAQGNWIVNGRPVAVDPETRLKGVPAPGQRVQIEARLLSDGTVVASDIEGDDNDSEDSGAETKIKGIITEVRDNSVVIDGREIALSVLTELGQKLQVGALVKVKALLQNSGSLVARGVEQDDEGGDDDEQERVEIEGVIESVSPDGGTLIVNGINVAITALSDVRGAPVVGAEVEVKGLLQEDGGILAARLKVAGRGSTESGTETRVAGVLDQVNTDEAGNVTSVVVDGLEIPVDVLTKGDRDLKPGGTIEVRGIISDGQFVAGKIKEKREEREKKEKKEADEEDGGSAASPGLQIDGLISETRTNDAGEVVGITVNGVDIDVSGANITGDLVVGQVVNIAGELDQGVIRPKKIDSERPEKPERPERPESAGPGASGKAVSSEVSGPIDAVLRDADGNVTGIEVGGQAIVIDPLTRIDARLVEGEVVTVRGKASGDLFIALKVKADEEGAEEPETDSTSGPGKAKDSEGKSGSRDGKSSDEDSGSGSTTGIPGGDAGSGSAGSGKSENSEGKSGSGNGKSNDADSGGGTSAGSAGSGSSGSGKAENSGDSEGKSGSGDEESGDEDSGGG